MSRRFEPAAAVWGGLIVAGLASDVVLIRGAHRTLSDMARSRAGRVAQVVLLAHFANRLGRFDPFHAAARFIPRRP